MTRIAAGPHRSVVYYYSTRGGRGGGTPRVPGTRGASAQQSSHASTKGAALPTIHTAFSVPFLSSQARTAGARPRSSGGWRCGTGSRRRGSRSTTSRLLGGKSSHTVGAPMSAERLQQTHVGTIHRCCVRLRVSFSLFVFRFRLFVFAETYAHASRDRPQDLPQDCLDGMDVMLGVACRAGVVGASGPRWRVIVTHGLGFPSRFQIPGSGANPLRHANPVDRSLALQVLPYLGLQRRRALYDRAHLPEASAVRVRALPVPRHRCAAPSNTTRECPPSPLTLQGIALPPLLISQGIALPPFLYYKRLSTCVTVCRPRPLPLCPGHSPAPLPRRALDVDDPPRASPREFCVPSSNF